MYTENQIITNPSLLDSYKERDFITVSCSHCRKPLERRKRDLRKLVNSRKSKSIFCSQACMSEKAKTEGTTEVKCSQCGDVFRKHNSQIKGNSFCSHKCSAIYNNTLRARMKAVSYTPVKDKTEVFKQPKVFLYKKRKSPGIINCLSCNSEITLFKNRKFCDVECQAEYQRTLRVEEWLKTGKAGESNYISSSPLHYVRQYIREKQNNKCAICEIENVWQGKPLVLILDHIDGNSSNNAEPNLRLVCSNCDSQLPTYKAKNKNSGRHYRKQRYRDGKSF